jgi:hypothetical protein
MVSAVGYIVDAMAGTSTFNSACFLTKSFTCSTELAMYKLSVPYSKLPAQFCSSVSASRAKSGDTTGPAMIAESSLIKLLLFMPKGQGPWNLKFGWRTLRFWP